MSLSALISGVLALTGALPGQPEVGREPPPIYAIIDLGTLGGWTSVARGINEVGQVVGSADTTQGLRHAYLWEAGVMRDLGTMPPAAQSEATELNNNAQVVGLCTNNGLVGAAFLWEQGWMIDLGHLTGADTGNTSATAINDAGQVVGISTAGAGERHAFLWEDGVMSDLSTSVGGEWSIAWDINEVGQVVGGQYLWEDGTITRLGTLGGEVTQAFGMNDHEQVVGSSERVAGERIFHAFLWEDGEMTDLGAIGGFENSRAEAINNSGHVIGSPGFLYHGDMGMLILQELICADSGWSQLSPRDINDAGQIAGVGTIDGTRHAFLMTPIDADFDDDGHTDLLDFATFQSCLALWGPVIEPGCRPCDINRDGEVDLADYRAFWCVFAGPASHW